MDCKGTKKWNFANLTKMPESFDSQDSGTFFGFELSQTSAQLRAQQIEIHFACHFRVLKSGTLQIQKRARILRFSGLGRFFGFAKFHFLVPVQSI
jgi:hypothetical protein